MMETQKFIWMDGKLVPWGEANVHFLTHSLHYGTGVFEGIRFYKTPKGPAIFRLPEHIDRLYESAKAFAMEIPFSKDEFSRAIIETIIANELEEGYIRPLVYLGG
ncbi:MAG: aminotransferase class IV, partial [bacterium]|nr:aminotransferase class IV [bacterium]